MNISETVYSAIARPDLLWFCDSCVKPALQSVKTDKAIEDKCREFFESVEARIVNVENELANKASVKEVQLLSKEVQSLESRVSQLTSTQAEVENKIGEATSNAASVSMKEIADREARKTNLIIFNASVSNSEDTETRRREDMEYFRTLCEKGLELSDQVQCQKIARLGLKTSKQRPMRVTLKDSEQVNTVMKAAKKLSGKTGFTGVSIARDRTPLEREETRALVNLKEQKQKESDMKKENARWVIRRNQVVNAQRDRHVDPQAEKGRG